MTMTMQWILYGILIAVMGVVGFYVGKAYTTVGATMGTIGGLVVGSAVAGAIWYYSDMNSGEYIP